MEAETVATGSTFVRIDDRASLEAWLGGSGIGVIYLHDPYCPISATAYREVSRLPGPIGLVDVAASPELSQAIEAKTKVRHESPQAIVLVDGDPIWSASHFRISERSVAEALEWAQGLAGEGGADRSVAG